MADETGPCAVCGGESDPDMRCDDCECWLCPDHLVIEAQAWDVHGWDGVDYRCRDHRRMRLGDPRPAAGAVSARPLTRLGVVIQVSRRPPGHIGHLKKRRHGM